MSVSVSMGAGALVGAAEHQAGATIARAPLLPPGSLLGRVLDWSKQPSTQQGMSLVTGGCVLAWLHPFASAEGIAATMLAASLPRLWPDNTTDAIRTRDLANAIAHAAATRRSVDVEQAADVAARTMAAELLPRDARPAA